MSTTTQEKTKTVPSLAEVDGYVVPDLLRERVARVHNVPQDFADGLLREAKRMLYLCIVSDDSVAPSDRVDWGWHEMLMFTQYYRDFSAFIGGFVHHVPNPPTSEEMKEETWEEIQATLGEPRNGSAVYNKTKTNYEKYFGEKADPLYWP